MIVPNNNLFAEFAPISKAGWLTKIEKDLKGRPLSELNWVLDTPLSISPFLHADDFPQKPQPILDNRAANTWAIAEDIEVADCKAANKQTLAALTAGVNAPRFIFDNFPTSNELAVLLENIELDYITTHFQEKTEKESPLSILKIFHTYAGSKAANLNGAAHYDPFSDARHDAKAATDLVAWASEHLPYFAVITVNAERFYEGKEGVISELTQALSAGNAYLKQLTYNGLSPDLVQKALAFRFSIGSSYFVEIAKLRAFKLLWGNVLSAYNVTPSAPRLFARTSVVAFDEDVNIHKIKATTQAMSAVTGGIEALTVAPSENSDFGRRIARNIQHLLAMESYFDRVADPAAGSYYIEKLTEQLAETVWAAFQTIN